MAKRLTTLHAVKWPSGARNWLSSNTTDNAGRKLENILLDYGLEQVIHEPTRGGNLLDLIITSHPAMCNHSGTMAPLGDSDHLSTFAILNLKATRPSKQKNTAEAWSSYRSQRNLVTALTRRAEATYLREVLEDVEGGNTRRLFKYTKTVLGQASTGVPALKLGNNILDSPREKATALNDFFVQQTDLPGRDDPSSAFVPPVSPKTPLESLQVTVDEVRQQLLSLKVGKSCGPDDITPNLLRRVADSISRPLTHLFNMSLSLGQVPSRWKEANVTPIHKGGSRHALNNYRPISLLNSIPKVLENLVNKRLNDHIRPMLTKHQSGFRAYDNTTLQLVRLVDEWTKAMDKGEVVGCVFLDLRKAFDKVWHHGLLAKLAGYGIRGSVLEWFCSYLTDRRQRVVVNGATSDWKTPLAGVPQGSILGPTLFILYINDLPSRCTTCEANLFADDTSLTVAHRSINTVVDSLNTDLATVSEWLQHWKLEANRDKCKVMFLTTRPLPQRIPPVILAGTTLQIVHSHKHLGVTLTSKLTWSAHVEAMTNKARRTAGMLCALRKKVPKTILLQLYKIIVRPVLEYADIVWGGLTMRDQKTIESVQYRSARVISGHHGIPYPSHKSLYSQFALPSLSYRPCKGVWWRLRFDRVRVVPLDAAGGLGVTSDMT
ncbi:hypothetical protein Bbelb_142440 [Branchiostoma belcheri]|nr:hypothetical protein Bbelb_142440 [Branchiostoma belcheri]